jgi:hypothetical protein
MFDLFACHAIPAAEENWDLRKEGYPAKLNYHAFKLGAFAISQNFDTIHRWVRNAQDWCRLQADLMMEDMREHAKRLEKIETQSMSEERKLNDERRLTSDRKRKVRLEFEQEPRAKQARAEGSSSSTVSSAPSPRSRQQQQLRRRALPRSRGARIRGGAATARGGRVEGW